MEATKIVVMRSILDVDSSIAGIMQNNQRESAAQDDRLYFQNYKNQKCIEDKSMSN